MDKKGDANQLKEGEGKVIDQDGQMVAVYKDEDGALHTLSAECTHEGCVVEFNEQDATWDCPCHGSRFSLDGSVIQGPAENPLSPNE